MGRHLLRFGSIVNERFLLSCRCSSSSSMSSIPVPVVECGGTVVARKQRSKMIRARWRRHNWDVDPLIKDKFNEITKGSHSFTAANTQNAIERFTVLTKNAKVPDYMAVKMASIVTVRLGWAEGKKILNTHYMCHGAENRFAGESSLLDEQVEGALQRIFDSDDEDAYTTARQFYCSLIDLKFCKVKKGALKIFMLYLLSKGQITDAIEKLNYFANYGKHGSLSTAVFLVLRAAFKENSALFEKAKKVLKTIIKSRLQQICVMGCVFLAEGFHIRFVDLLREQNYNISVEDVEFICDLARNCKEPSILESFVAVHELFSLNDDSRTRIYESLTEIHGKASNLNGLLKIWERVVAEKKLNNFRIVILKLGHFYRCNDFSIPNELQYYLKQYRE